MRHDAKLGLALGMLVIGFAVAFCFPRQPERAHWEKPEVPASIVDPSLNFLPIRAYQTRPADVAQPDSPRPSEQVPNPAPTVFIPPEVPGELPSAPTPISPIVENRIPSLAEIEASAKPSRDESPEKPDLSRPFISRPSVYRVKAGDTLSGIASACLGSSAKYRELFEANQDILTSPNDLKIGMELRIPPLPGKDERVEIATERKSDRETGWNGLEPRPANRTGVFEGIQHPPAAPWLSQQPSERH